MIHIQPPSKIKSAPWGTKINISFAKKKSTESLEIEKLGNDTIFDLPNLMVDSDDNTHETSA